MNNIIDGLKQFFPAAAHRRIFLVGGAVRDILQGKLPTDIDLAAALTTEEFLALGFRLVTGRSTAAIWQRSLAGLGTLEVTPIRAAADLTDDLHRRDFSINAMALTMEGAVIDPLDARSDLAQRRLSPCSVHTFSDDPLRVFRAFRFTADGWNMVPQCEKLLRKRDWNAELTGIPVERFSREMLKALEAATPERFFQSMLVFEIGAAYIPELFRMPQIPAGPPLHHPEGDLFTHSLQVLQRVTSLTADPLTRFCALFHAIGKLSSAPALYPRHHGHDLAGFGTALEFCQRLRLPAGYGKVLAWISRLHGTFNLWDQLRDATKVRVAEQAFKAGIIDILPCVAAADKTGGSEPEQWRVALRVAGMSATELGVDLQVLERMGASKRPDHILQKRVEAFRTTLTAST